MEINMFCVALSMAIEQMAKEYFGIDFEKIEQMAEEYFGIDFGLQIIIVLFGVILLIEVIENVFNKFRKKGK